MCRPFGEILADFDTARLALARVPLLEKPKYIDPLLIVVRELAVCAYTLQTRIAVLEHSARSLGHIHAAGSDVSL